jgi:polyhydroxyalkanoate synthesis regulator phasin
VLIGSRLAQTVLQEAVIHRRMEHLMQNEQVDQDHISGKWRRAWTTILNFAEAIETSPMEYMLDRISYLEREVASLKSELQSRAQAHERHHD